VLQDRDLLAERTVLLKGLRPGVAYDVRVTFEDQQQNRVSETFTGVEVVNGAAALADGGDNAPPRISDVRVGPLSAGPFLSTTVTWETDEPATSAVMYGASEGYGQSVRKEGGVWVRHHRVAVNGLARGREYHFRVQSTDMYGNTSRSGDGQFSMAGSVSPSRFASQAGGGLGEGMGRISVTEARVFLEGSDLGLYLETSKPATVRLEWIETDALPASGDPGRQQASEYDVRLDGLRTGRALTIDACNQSGCHPPASLGISHPVGVPLRNRMPVPENLPTLEGGIITCVTCHSPHGGTRKYFAQDDFSKKICLTCHTEF
jgi:predicted CXXCH cytochrome family protein